VHGSVGCDTLSLGRNLCLRRYLLRAHQPLLNHLTSEQTPLQSLAMASNTTDFKYGQHVFGPAMPDQFDFTSLFENYFFSIVPSAILFLVLPFRLRSLQNRPKKVSRSLLHSNKLVRKNAEIQCQC
jgi:hypothetical protein